MRLLAPVGNAFSLSLTFQTAAGCWAARGQATGRCSKTPTNPAWYVRALRCGEGGELGTGWQETIYYQQKKADCKQLNERAASCGVFLAVTLPSVPQSSSSGAASRQEALIDLRLITVLGLIGK